MFARDHRRVLYSTLLLGILACGSDGPTAPQAGPSLGWTFTPDAGVRVASGVQASPLVVNGNAYLYLSNGNAPNTVGRTTDGLTFTPVSARYPLGSSYSFVTLPDGRIRMYFFDPVSAALQSATSTDGLNWTNEPGTRITLNRIAVPKVVAAAGGYRVYYTADKNSGSGILSAFSTDGLTFSADPGARLNGGSTFAWGDPAAINTGSGWIALATEIPNDRNSYSSIWLASSPDGLTWTLDAKPLITSTAGSPVDAAFVPVGNGYRIYYGLVVGASAVTTNGTVQIMSGLLTR